MRSVQLSKSTTPIANAPSDETSDELTKTAHTGYPPRTQRNIFAVPLLSPPTVPQNGKPHAPHTCLSYHIMRYPISSDVVHDVIGCHHRYRPLLAVSPSSRPRPVIISYRIPDDTATQSITCDTGYDGISFSLAPLLAHRIAHRPTASRPASRLTVSPHGSVRNPTQSYTLLVSSRLACSYRLHLIGSSVPPVACLPRPTHAVAIHLIHLISLVSSHRLIARISSPAQSDETSDEQAKRRTARSIDNRKAERHDIRYLPDTANAPPRPPYSPYKPNNARIPTRTRPWENDPSTSLTTPQTGRQRNDGRDETTGRRLLAYRHDNEATTPPPASRHEQRNAERHGELLPAPRHDNTGRTTGRTDCEMRDGTRGGRSLAIARSLLRFGLSCGEVLLGAFYSAVKSFQCGGLAGWLIASLVVPPVRYFNSAGRSFCSLALFSLVASCSLRFTMLLFFLFDNRLAAISLSSSCDVWLCDCVR